MKLLHVLPILGCTASAVAQTGSPRGAAVDNAWRQSGELTLLTGPEGAALPEGAVVEGFPLLVRLDREWFDFGQAQTGGADLRFTASTGEPLAFEIEAWDAVKGEATVWVRIPRIVGNARQSLRMHWSNPAAASASDGRAVFDESNGYLSVWHLGDAVEDVVGTLASRNDGTTVTAGAIGSARWLEGGQGIFGGDSIEGYPTGAESHTSQAWIRPRRPNATFLAWGNEEAQGKVVAAVRSPPHVRVDCYFSGADVASSGRLRMDDWSHVVHTCRKGDSRIYVDGALVGASTTADAPLAIKSPARLWIGGWYDRYDFVGAIDEARVSRVVRSPDWIRLEFENQKPMQTVVGPLIQPGTRFAVAPASAVVDEGQQVAFTAEAGGAQRVDWTLVRGGVETVIAVNRFSCTVAAGRVSGDESATLRFRAVDPEGVKTVAVPIAIRERIADPQFTLRAPAAWDGRTPIEVVPEIAHLAERQTGAAGDLSIEWSVAPLAVLKRVVAGRLVLERAQNSGDLTVTATMSNGGRPTSHSVKIAVTEPPRDAWVARVPAAAEKPEAGQFFARDERNEGTLVYNGTVAGDPDEVFLRVFAGDALCRTETAPPTPNGAYALTVKLAPGLVKYRVEFGTRKGASETVLDRVGDLVCGDAYVLNGQSNAVATDWGEGGPPAFRSEWIRTFGTMSGSAERVHLWGEACPRSEDGERLQIGYWAMELARRLVARQRIPICILNGAVGGTRIDQHQRNPADPTDPATIYGRLLWRVREARLTHGIRGVWWHQGENDQGADGPTGRYGFEDYREHFLALAADWKRDFPNLQHYHVFQIWPKACAMGVDGSDNRLREVQRNLPTAFSRMGIVSTVGIEPSGGCHYPPAGYEQLAVNLLPLIERDHYEATFARPITPPNLLRAAFVAADHAAIALEFDQPVGWRPALADEFWLDGENGKVVAGHVAGNVLTLELAAPSSAATITYLDSRSWSQQRLLRGATGIAALTFCDVPIDRADGGR